MKTTAPNLEYSRPNFAVLQIRGLAKESIREQLIELASHHRRWVSLEHYDKASDSSHDLTARLVEVTDRFDSPWQHEECLPALAEIISSNWGMRINMFSPIGISRYVEGSRLPEHIDTTYEDGRLVTFIWYLRVSREGGEICFPTIGLKILPEPGDVLAFPSNLVHAVNEVVSGNRFVAVWFGKIR